MTLDELQHWQPGFTKRSGAAQRRLPIHARHVEGPRGETGADRKRDLLARVSGPVGYELLRRRGYQPWIDGKTTTDTFMVGLAREWASFPVPIADEGRAPDGRERGETYYAGDRLNKALIGPTRSGWPARRPGRPSRRHRPSRSRRSPRSP